MFTNLFHKKVRLLLLHKLLRTIPCAEYAKCTVTGCHRCSLLPSVQNMLSAQLPDMSQVLITANCAEYAKCTVTGYVTGAPYCQLCRVC